MPTHFIEFPQINIDDHLVFTFKGVYNHKQIMDILIEDQPEQMNYIFNLLKEIDIKVKDCEMIVESLYDPYKFYKVLRCGLKFYCPKETQTFLILRGFGRAL